MKTKPTKAPINYRNVCHDNKFMTNNW